MNIESLANCTRNKTRVKDICLLLLSEGLIFLHLAAWMSGRAVGVEAIERLVIPEKKKKQ